MYGKLRLVCLCLLSGLLLSLAGRAAGGRSRILQVPASGGPLPQPSAHIWYGPRGFLRWAELDPACEIRKLFYADGVVSPSVGQKEGRMP